MSKFSDYSALAEQAISQLSYPAGDLDTLYAPISYGMAAGGKRLRPALLLLAADAFGGIAAEALRPAAGIEMFHNFTLLHDDVMDNSDTRRGRPSVMARWGTNAAILSGDTMLTLATQLIADVRGEILKKVLDAFNDMAIKVYEGQALDMDFETREEVSLDEYIRMIELKTGALIATSAYIGALIGGASEEDARRMYEFGMKLGVAFQIQDDWLDVYGDAATFGKPIGGDICNGKKSFLLLSGLSANSADADSLREAMKIQAGPLRVKTVTAIYDKIGISEICRRRIAAESSEAISALKATSMPDTYKEIFRKLTDKLTGRKK